MSPDPYETARIENLRDLNAFRYCSGEELRIALDPAPGWDVADLGSGVGLFTDELAPVVDTVFAVDIRRGLHDAYRDAGIPANAVALTADAERLPLAASSLDGAVSVRTYHHGMEPALPEIARVLCPGGRLVIVDWSATGAGDREFRMDEEYADLATVQSHLLENGFRIRKAQERRETFLVVGERR